MPVSRYTPSVAGVARFAHEGLEATPRNASLAPQQRVIHTERVHGSVDADESGLGPAIGHDHDLLSGGGTVEELRQPCLGGANGSDHSGIVGTGDYIRRSWRASIAGTAMTVARGGGFMGPTPSPGAGGAALRRS